MINQELTRTIDHRRIVIAILWPSFVSAGIALVFLFLLVDPVMIADALNLSDASRISIYSISFIFFWLQAILASAFCLIFIAPTDHLNKKKKHKSSELSGD